jgi:hypothetical protein
MRKSVAFAVAALTCIAGFFAGAWWHALLALEPPRGPSVAPITLNSDRPIEPKPSHMPESVQSPSPPPPDPRERESCPQLATALTFATQSLASAQTELRTREEKRIAREGTPIALPEKTEPRFEPEHLRSAVSDALTQAKVPGRVDGLDCSEWPCIIYGRIRGTEDEMEKLEGAKSLAQYERDILSVLLWVVTDEAANAAPVPGLPGKPEQTLFAFALYPRGLERTAADNIDRRVRSRTAELWNTMSPSDETGR